MPLILPGNVASAIGGDYDVDNSCRFNKGDTAYMHKTLSAGNRRTWTFSTWFKRISLGTQVTFGVVQTSTGNDNIMAMQIRSDNKLEVWDYAGGITAAIVTNRLFRDTGAWYHVCVAADTTSGTANNRLRLYINGTEERDVGGYATDTMPSENYDFNINENTKVLKFGAYDGGSVGSPADFYFAETVFIDGTQYAASDFGEFNSDSPTIFQPKDVSGLTFGTNGFYLDYKDSSNLGNDANGGTDLTEVSLAATDQSVDTPTNNFPTLNVLYPTSNLTFTEGNLNVVASDANYRSVPSTMGATAGKWYAEFKAVSGFSSVDKSAGIYRADNSYVATTGLGNFTSGTTWSYGAHGNIRTNNGNNDTGEATFTDGDIIGVAMDLDNNKLYFAKNNSWINSGDPESGSTGTGAYAIVNATPKEFYHFAVASISSGGAGLWSCNFGSPSYANSSDAADANGYGAFEYAPPSGYLALCSKNLGSDGG